MVDLSQLLEVHDTEGNSYDLNTILAQDGKILVIIAARPIQPWQSTATTGFIDYFQHVRLQLTLPRGSGPQKLSDGEIKNVAGAVGYAFKEVIRGEELSDPVVVKNGNFNVTLDFKYDTEKSKSSAPNFELAFELASAYIVDGSPVYRKDHADGRRKGERLIPGLGSLVIYTEFFVR